MIGFVAVFGMLIVLALGMFTLRFYRALTQGYMGNGEVISVVYNRHGATNTLDSIENEIERGRWRILTHSKVFEEDFETDEPWASGLQPGRHVRVLVNLKTSRVLHTFGTADAWSKLQTVQPRT